MNIPGNLKYTKEHTWIRLEGETGIVGITEFAQSELGDIVYVDLPSIGNFFGKNEVFGSVEALKTVSDLFLPVAGSITAINPFLKDQPTLVNTDPFGQGWMIKVLIANKDEIYSLLDSEAYQKSVE